MFSSAGFNGRLPLLLLFFRTYPRTGGFWWSSSCVELVPKAGTLWSRTTSTGSQALKAPPSRAELFLLLSPGTAREPPGPLEQAVRESSGHFLGRLVQPGSLTHMSHVLTETRVDEGE